MAKPEFVTFLRELADFYEARPNLPEPYWLDDNISVYLPADKAKEHLANLGSFEKEFGSEYFYAKKHVGGRMLRFMAEREQVCVRKVVGTRHVDAHVIPSSFTPEQLIEAHEEEIVEWDCEPVLKPRESTEEEIVATPVAIDDDDIPF